MAKAQNLILSSEELLLLANRMYTFVGLQRILIRCETESHTYSIEEHSVG